MTYHICNNYNISERSTSNYEEAVGIAQAIANRDCMPAFIDFMDPAQTTVKVEPMSSKAMLDGAKSVAQHVMWYHATLSAAGVEGTSSMNLA